MTNGSANGAAANNGHPAVTTSTDSAEPATVPADNGYGTSTELAVIPPARANRQKPPAPAALPDVYRAICQVQKAISRDGISKGRQNQQQGYSFRGVDDIYNALSALLAGADLCILPRMLSRTQEERATKDGKGLLFYVTVQADFDFVSARDASRHTVTMYGEAMDSADKATNKAMSAAYKYACLQVFCIPTEGMAADADATTPEPAPKSAAVAPKPALNTAAAANAVAEEKIRTGKAATPKPWTNRGEMKRAFGMMRERLGEVIYLDALGLYSATAELNWKDAGHAIDCWHHLDLLARREAQNGAA